MRAAGFGMALATTLFQGLSPIPEQSRLASDRALHPKRLALVTAEPGVTH